MIDPVTIPRPDLETLIHFADEYRKYLEDMMHYSDTDEAVAVTVDAIESIVGYTEIHSLGQR